MGAKSRKHFYFARGFGRRKLVKLEGKRLFEQFVIVRLVDRRQKFPEALAAEYLQWFLPLIDAGRPLDSGQEWRQPSAMIQMQVANPDGVEIHPVEVLLGHPVRSVGAAIKQNRAR